MKTKLLDVNTSLAAQHAAQHNAKWRNVACLGLVQACMGAVVVTTTTTLNRVMVVELALPAVLPGVLIGLHYLIQIVRPRMGFGADQSQRFTPWILGGMATLSIGGILAALATTLMANHFLWGVGLALWAFAFIGLGVSACGTTLLVLLSKSVGEQQRATSATLVWTMMIFGFAVTSMVSGKMLDPFSMDRLLEVSVAVSVLTMTLSSLAMWGLERRMLASEEKKRDDSRADFSAHGEIEVQPHQSHQSHQSLFKPALLSLWQDRQARLFTFFVFTSMLAYSAQDLILEPFAALIYHFTPGQTTQLSGTLHASVLMGMLAVAFIGGRWVNARLGQVSSWMVIGCLLSGVGMLGLSTAGVRGSVAQLLPLNPILMVLGFGNGLFSIAAISTMMRLATQAPTSTQGGSLTTKPGLRMGLWGGAQAVAFGLGGLLGTGASDLARHWMGNPSLAYASVFALESALFVCSALIAWRVKGIQDESCIGEPKAHAKQEMSGQLTLKNAT